MTTNNTSIHQLERKYGGRGLLRGPCQSLHSHYEIEFILSHGCSQKSIDWRELGRAEKRLSGR